jgi:hypothetical protein
MPAGLCASGALSGMQRYSACVRVEAEDLVAGHELGDGGADRFDLAGQLGAEDPVAFIAAQFQPHSGRHPRNQTRVLLHCTSPVLGRFLR